MYFHGQTLDNSTDEGKNRKNQYLVIKVRMVVTSRMDRVGGMTEIGHEEAFCGGWKCSIS